MPRRSALWRAAKPGRKDIDVLVELDLNQPIGIFEYARLKIYVNEIRPWSRAP